MMTSPAPPHAPSLGLARRLLGPLHVTGIFWYRFHRFGAAFLPGWAVGAFIAVFTTFFFFTLVRIRRAVAGNLEAVLGPCGFWRRQVRIYRTLWTFAWCLTERYERLSTHRRVGAAVEGAELWGERLARPAGLLLVTAHLGHWEVGSMLPAAAVGRPLHVVREEEMDPRAQRFVRDLIARAAPANYTVHFAQPGDPALGGRLLAALRRGEVVALQGDRPRAGSRTVAVELFGRPYEMPAGPVTLARAAGVEMLPVFVHREGRQRARVVVRPPVRPDPAAPAAEDLARMARALAAEVEAAIRRRPYQWFCFRELWPGGAGRAGGPRAGARCS